MAQNNFRCPVVPGLDVIKPVFMRMHARTEINKLDAYLTYTSTCLRFGLQQYILWLDVRMDDSKLAKEGQRVEQLNSEPAYEVHTDALELVELEQLVKTQAEQLEHDALY